jgi:hypothetical protein
MGQRLVVREGRRIRRGGRDVGGVDVVGGGARALRVGVMLRRCPCDHD